MNFIVFRFQRKLSLCWEKLKKKRANEKPTQEKESNQKHYKFLRDQYSNIKEMHQAWQETQTSSQNLSTQIKIILFLSR